MRYLFSAAITTFLLVMITSYVFAIGPVVGASCTLSWTEPQTNTDGSNLTDLKEYQIYITQTSGVYGNVAAKIVPAVAADPAPNANVTTACPSGLPQGQNYAVVLAVDTAGNASPRSNEAPFVYNTVSPNAPGGFTVNP